MNSYLLTVDGREAGPFSDAQIAQMFADKRVYRDTQCKPATGGDWRTIDDYLPTLKYGSQLPPASATAPSVRVAQSREGAGVRVTDIDVPFGSILKMAFKIFAAWLIVLICFVPLILIFWFTVFAGILTFFSGLHQ